MDIHNRLINNEEIILTHEKYKFITTETYKYFDITDKVVCFYDGKDWNVILLNDMLAYPILYFDFWSSKDDTTYVNSLVVCPITLRSMIYKGKITIVDINNDRLKLLNNDTNDEFFMDSPYTGSYDKQKKEKHIKSHVKRHEVKLSTFRDILTFLFDPKFIIVNKKNDMIITTDYYSNKLTYDEQQICTSFHPKTIVYMIQYFSHKLNQYKYTVIVGKDINKNDITGYSLKHSKVWHFINKHHTEFIKKRAYIYPIFWFMVDNLYDNVNIIHVK